jgi:ABC-type transport system involved in multi-copper enzyme maturation permease subunit
MSIISSVRAHWSARPGETAALAALAAGAAGLVALARWPLLPLPYQIVLWGVWLAGLVVVGRLFGPVLYYDLVRSARRLRFVVVRTIYALGISFILCWIFLVLVADAGWRQPADQMSRFATGFLYAYLVVQYLTVVLLTPAYTAGAIAEEKERRTLEFILATDLENREIILGKVVSRVLNLTLLLLAGVPIISFLQFLGGVDFSMVLAGFAATALTMYSMAGLSILNSVMCRRARDAIVMTYLMALAYGLIATGAWVVIMISTAGGWWPELANFPSYGSFVSPVTLKDLVDWLNAGNIIVAIFRLGRGASATAVFDQELPAVLGGYSLFHAIAGTVCLLWAILRLRVLGLRDDSRRPAASRMEVTATVLIVLLLVLLLPLGIIVLPLWLLRGRQGRSAVARDRSDDRATPRGKATRSTRKPVVGRHPMIWKEVFAEGGLRLNMLGRIVAGVLVIASFIPTVIIFWLYFTDDFAFRGMDAWREVTRAMNGAQMRFVGTVVAVLMLLAVVVRAAGSVHSERERSTLDELLTTRLTNAEILFGKWLGAILSVRWGWAWLGLIWFICLVTGGVQPYAIPLMFVSWVVYASVGAGIGLWFSIGSKSTLRATVWSLATILFLFGGHWLVTGMFCYMPMAALGVHERDFDWMLYLQSGQTPPFVLGWFAFSGEEFTRGDAKESVKFTMASLFGVGCWAALVPLLWHLVKRRFETVTGRVASLRPERAMPRSRRRLPAKRALLIDDPPGNGKDGGEQILTALPAEEKEVKEKGDG